MTGGAIIDCVILEMRENGLVASFSPERMVLSCRRVVVSPVVSFVSVVDVGRSGSKKKV